MSSRIALVTGGSRGLGAEIVRELAEQGHDVFFTYIHDAESAAKVVSDVQAIGRRAVSREADVRDYALARDVVQSVISEFGGLHALVCNAGIAVAQPIEEMTEEGWDTVVDTCLKGSFNYIRAAAPVFREQRDGAIVCTGSINAFRGRPGTASYNAAKAGLSGLVRTVAAELGPYDVNVNAVAPGFIETQPSYPPGRKEEILSECAIKRLGQPEDIAPVIAFLCSDDARHVTGQTITVDAGQSLSRPLGER